MNPNSTYPKMKRDWRFGKKYEDNAFGCKLFITAVFQLMKSMFLTFYRGNILCMTVSKKGHLFKRQEDLL